MTILSSIGLLVIIFLLLKSNIFNLLLCLLGLIFITPLIYNFWFSYIDVQIRKKGRELDGDLLFVSEYFASG